MMNILMDSNKKTTFGSKPEIDPGLRISRITAYTDIDSIRADWETLEKEIPGLPIFLTWDWMSCWWNHFGHGAELWLLAAQKESGRIIAIAPLMVQKYTIGFFQFRRIQFIGSGTAYPAHLDLIAHREYQDVVCSTFISYLFSCKDKWDIIDLEGLHSESRLAAFLQKQPKGWYRQGLRQRAAFISLPLDWESFLMGSISGKLRRNLKHRRRNLEQDHSGQVTIHMVRSQEELSLATDSFIVLHQKRWVEKGYSTAVTNQEFVAFLRSAISIALTSKRLRFLQLLAGEEVIAANICFRNGDVFYVYQKAFNPEWSKYSPGQIVQAEMIKVAIEEGAREFDMLPGSDEDKDLWASNMHWDDHIMYGHNWRGAVWLLTTNLIEKARLLGRKTLPNGMRRKIERVYSSIGYWIYHNMKRK